MTSYSYSSNRQLIIEQLKERYDWNKSAHWLVVLSCLLTIKFVRYEKFISNRYKSGEGGGGGLKVEAVERPTISEYKY